MAELRMRPRFSLDVACDAELLVRLLEDRIETHDVPLEGSFHARHCVLRVPREQRALWSPELDLIFEPAPDDEPGVHVRCVFGPRPAVFTGFAFAYAVLGAFGVLGALFGLGQLPLDQPPWGFAVTAGALVAISAVYASSFMGQGLALAQMYEQRRYLAESIEAAEQQAHARPTTAFDSARL